MGGGGSKNQEEHDDEQYYKFVRDKNAKDKQKHEQISKSKGTISPFTNPKANFSDLLTNITDYVSIFFKMIPPEDKWATKGSYVILLNNNNDHITQG